MPDDGKVDGKAVPASPEPRKTRTRALSRLNALKVAKIKEPGLYEDGGGLRLVVTDQGTKRWALRVTINGRRVERGLGVYPLVSLEDARRRAEELRRAARDGRDAQTEAKQGRRAKGVTFRQAFDAFFAVRKQQLDNDKHIAQWTTTIETYVMPAIGSRPVADITAAEVLAILTPIWFSKPETASRVLQRMRAVFDSAILRQTRERANPCTGITNELGTDHRRVEHHAALSWRDVPAFVRDLRSRRVQKVTRLSFEFLVLCASRSGEVRSASWREIDLDARLWSIPIYDPVTGQRRFKGDEPHVVPLSSRAVEILSEARQLHAGDLVFPGKKGQPLSDNTLSKLMRDARLGGTPHGFRSAFKDWCAENGVRDEVSEAALGHADPNKVRAAYRRTRFLAERVHLMQKWSDFVTGSDGQRAEVSPPHP